MVTALTIIQIIALILIFLELLYIGIQPPSKLQVDLLLLVISTFLMMTGYLFEIKAQTLNEALYGTMFSYLGKPFTSIFATLFIIEYFQYRIPNKLKAALVIYHAMYGVLVLADPYIHLFYTSVGFDRSKLFSPLVISHGPAYYTYMATILAYLVLDIVICLKELTGAKNTGYKIQIFLIFFTPVSGIAGLLIFLTGIPKGYDSTMLGCFIGTITLGVLFVKFKIFDMVNYAKEQALLRTNSGLVVIDSRGKVTYENAAARNLQSIGLTLDKLTGRGSSADPIQYEGRYYHTEETELVRSGISYGTSVEIVDVTDSYLYSYRLERDVEERTRQIKKIQRSVIGSFAQIVESRDKTTGLHIQNTSNLVQLIAKQLQNNSPYSKDISDEFVERMAAAAPMHDIGKISVPDSILLKPGRFTPEEFEIMKTHTTAGAEIITSTMDGVESDEYIETAREMVLSHHERWDGKGYPNGLKGEEIPLPARIMAAADVYDALISERPYKEAYPVSKALDMIKEASGTQFDPIIVDAFMRVMGTEENRSESNE